MRGMKSKVPLITMLTDFGQQDHFVAAMKGVIAGICPEARVIDITHDVAPYAIQSGAFLLQQAWRYFPERTIHVAVVDPGVGSARRPLLLSAGGHYFLGPDNGLLSFALEEARAQARQLTQTRYMLPQRSATFHGRDIFAPCAAHLAAGVKATAMGPKIEDALRATQWKPTRLARRQWSGAVQHVDRFGNLITNFACDEFGAGMAESFALTAGTEAITQLVACYANAPRGEACLIAGSAGYFEIFLREAHAAKKLGLGVGAPLELLTCGKI
jgi:S-adenosyl-L-methionine hydrolase (adenosine-forming)